jgi:hypothetical protein
MNSILDSSFSPEASSVPLPLVLVPKLCALEVSPRLSMLQYIILVSSYRIRQLGRSVLFSGGGDNLHSGQPVSGRAFSLSCIWTHALRHMHSHLEFGREGLANPTDFPNYALTRRVS